MDFNNLFNTTITAKDSLCKKVETTKGKSHTGSNKNDPKPFSFSKSIAK